MIRPVRGQKRFRVWVWLAHLASQLGTTMASIEIDAYHAANLSAAEAAILLIGPKVGDEVTLSLSVKELVARGYLSMAFADRKRRFLPRKRVALLVSGSNIETPVDPLLNAVLNTFRSARLLDRV